MKWSEVPFAIEVIRPGMPRWRVIGRVKSATLAENTVDGLWVRVYSKLDNVKIRAVRVDTKEVVRCLP